MEAVMLERPSRVYRVLLPLLVVAFALSFVGRDNTPSDGRTYWIGAGEWAAFGALLLVTLVFTLAVAVRAVARPRKRSESGIDRREKSAAVNEKRRERS
jgi:hypothetical protein